MATRQEIIDALQAGLPDIDVTALEETPEGRIIGFVVSAKFAELEHEDRQQLIKQHLEKAIQRSNLLNVGPIAALNPDEAELKAADSD